jgi:radical SAM superfamily enzyme YgiQ (UPF0313 family)
MLIGKSKVKVLLINPPPKQMIEPQDMPNYGHIGLGYLSSYLESKGVACQVIDAKLQRFNIEQILSNLANSPPDVVGITAMTHEINQAGGLSEAIKKKYPNTIVIVGGVHVTALPGETLEGLPFIDAVVIGEGEYTFYEFIKSIENDAGWGEIKGLAFRDRNRIKINEPREFIENLDELPFPAWHLFPKTPTYSIMTARGCPYKCIFCARPYGEKIRERSPANVVDELEYLVNRFQAKDIVFRDESFGVHRQRAAKILDLIRERSLHKKMGWVAELRVDTVKYDLVKKMKEAGCTGIGLGIESGNKDVLKATGKGITLEQAVEAVKIAKRVNLTTFAYFILGHPFETYETAMDTINFAAKLNTKYVSIGIMVPYPKTKVAEMAFRGEGGYKILSDNWADFNKQIGGALELEGLKRRDLEKLQIVGYLKFYLSNFAFLRLFRMIRERRRQIFFMLKKLLKTHLSEK